MRKLIWGILIIVASMGLAEGQSIGIHMTDADLVAAGDIVEKHADEKFTYYSMNNVEMIHGQGEAPLFQVVSFRELCFHVHITSGTRSVLFLRELKGNITGLDNSIPTYAALATDMSVIPLDPSYENVLLGLLRQYSQALSGTAAQRAAVAAEMFQTAVEENIEPLLYSASYDVVATPGAKERLTPFDGVMALNRFQATSSFSRTKHRLLYALGELKPQGLIPALDNLVWSSEGQFYLDTIAAIYTHLKDKEAPIRLIADFDKLDELCEKNVIHVLGRLGAGAGVPAIRSLFEKHLQFRWASIVDALLADRSEQAVEALGIVASTPILDASFLALEALAQINTQASRSKIETVSNSDAINKTIRNKAAALLAVISR